MNELTVSESNYLSVLRADAQFWTWNSKQIARQDGVYARPLMSSLTAVLGVIGTAKQAPGLFRV